MMTEEQIREIRDALAWSIKEGGEPYDPDDDIESKIKGLRGLQMMETHLGIFDMVLGHPTFAAANTVAAMSGLVDEYRQRN